ncbi:MAG: hypothetical protein M1828_005496 [Chrysothrix sp. TS-e1954]|nr:MAG: hypothetical protein M1828_005496 [Chrysothrix sp. TS-e1954]
MASNFLYNAPPPTRLLAPARPISPSSTLKYLESYLTASETQPWLAPNFSFQDQHLSVRAGGLGEAIQIRNLRRVAAGLRGEWLGVTADEDLFSSGLGLSQDLPASNDTVLDGSTAVTTQALSGGAEEEVQGEWDGDGGDGDLTTKNYGEQMREQGEEGIEEGDIGESRAVIIEVPPKKKQKKRKRGELEAEEAHATETIDDRDHVEASAKKSKKRKAIDLEVEPAPPSGTTNGEIQHKFKSKKRRLEATEAESIPTVEPESAAEGGVNEADAPSRHHEPSKQGFVSETNGQTTNKPPVEQRSSKKRKSGVAEAVSSSSQTKAGESDLVNGDSSPKKKKKSKSTKSEADEHFPQTTDHAENGANGDVGSLKKSKKRKSEGAEADSATGDLEMSKANGHTESTKTPKKSDADPHELDTPATGGIVDKVSRRSAKKQRRKEEQRARQMELSRQRSED